MQNKSASVDINASAMECFEKVAKDFKKVLSCYKNARENQHLQYTLLSKAQDNNLGVEVLRYSLQSQIWPFAINNLNEHKWQHEVVIIIPIKSINKLSKQALLVINDGSPGMIKNSEDFSLPLLQRIAVQTRTVVITINGIPNKNIIFNEAFTPQKDDDAVAYSWANFLKDPDTLAFMPLQIPMMQAVIKAMDLAEKELNSGVTAESKIKQFIVTGVSKRGLTAWHAALVDSRVTAIVPFVFDGLNFSKITEHTYKTYGNTWPLAFYYYVKYGIDTKIHTAEFTKLLDIIDPISYFDKKSELSSLLKIPKYIVNVSGDDFFPPDSARLYLNELPKPVTLRVIPNSSHAGVRKFTAQTLFAAVNRLQKNQPLPTIDSDLGTHFSRNKITLKFSEMPVKLIQWTAVNLKTRDFRYSSGIKYVATQLTSTLGKSTAVLMPRTISGSWTASFVEAHFKDGFTSTTPVYVLPQDVYPRMTSPSLENSSKS